MSPYTSFLYAEPSATEGVGRLVDFGGELNRYNVSGSEAEADARAIRADWCAVGTDMRSAMGVVASRFGVARKRLPGRAKRRVD